MLESAFSPQYCGLRSRGMKQHNKKDSRQHLSPLLFIVSGNHICQHLLCLLLKFSQHKTHLLFEWPKLSIQRGGELQDHSAGHCRIAGPQEHLLRSSRVWRQHLGVIVAGQEQPSRCRRVQSGHDVGESDLASRRRGLERVQVYGPASRQRGQGGGDVLKWSRELMMRGECVKVRKLYIFTPTCCTDRLPCVPGRRSIRMGRRWASHRRVPSTWEARRRIWAGEHLLGLWDSWRRGKKEQSVNTSMGRSTCSWSRGSRPFWWV